MRHGNWEPFVRAALDATLRQAETAAVEAGAAERALARRLKPGAPHEAITPWELRADPDLSDARESFRERHRRHMALRDECAGLEMDLEMMRAEPH